MNKADRSEVQRLVRIKMNMKRLLFAFVLCSLAFSFVPRTTGAEVGIDYFYDNLAGGSWIDVEGYGYCWQPDVAVNDENWRPYTDGYWAYTDAGWTWISYEDFGWATYHYGRWARLADYGWVWVPGADLEWGPAWVSWRTGGDYIGWAPLPPRGPEIVYESQPIGPQVDIEFSIGPEYYNFCDVRYIGEPVLRQRIVDYRQNVTYINETVNVTNITVQNNVVYNYGPDINFVSQRSSRPIQRLRLQREENVDLTAAARSGAVTKVQGNSLIVAAPVRLTKPAKNVAPPNVKTKVAQPKIERGWAGIDPNTRTQIEKKIKTEDHDKIPPAGAAAQGTGRTHGGAGAAQPGVGASPATGGTPGSEVAGGKGRANRGQQISQGSPPTTAASASPGTSAAPGMATGAGQHRGRRGEQLGTNAASISPSIAPKTTPDLPSKHGSEVRSNAAPTPLGSVAPTENLNQTRGKHQREHVEAGDAGPTSAPTSTGDRGEGSARHKQPAELSPSKAPAGVSSGENVNPPSGKRHRLEETPPTQGGQGTQQLVGPSPNAPRGGKHNAEGANGPAGATAAPTGEQPKHEREKKGEKVSPTVPPQ